MTTTTALPMTPVEFCDRYAACLSGRAFALQHATMAEVWDACERPDWLFWILERVKPLEKEQSVRLAIAFAETALVHVPEGEDRPRLAIEAARAWLAEPTEANRAAARAAVYAADAAADAAAVYAVYAADAAADAAAVYAVSAADAAADAAAVYAVYAARAARAAARAAADAANCKIIREVIPNPFKSA